MSLRERIRDRLDEARETIGDLAFAVATRMYGETDLVLFSPEALKVRDTLMFRAGVEAGKVAAGMPDIHLIPEPIDE